MTVPVPAGSHPVSAVVTSPGRAIIAAQVSLASGRANMNNVTGTLPVANGGTGANTASGARENLGIVPMTTAQVDDVMDDDEEVVSDNVVNGTVFTYIWGKIKAWAAAAFAPSSHTHTQSNISDLPIDVANGGTGATTASGARTNLEITPSNIGAAPTSHNHSGDALTPASVAATGAVSGSSVSDSVGSLASLRESVSQLNLVSATRIAETYTTGGSGNIILPYQNDGKTAIIAVFTNGTGYHGRTWISPSNNYWVTTIINPNTGATVNNTQVELRYWLLKFESAF